MIYPQKGDFLINGTQKIGPSIKDGTSFKSKNLSEIKKGIIIEK
jgi:hypothetical protein